MSALLDDLALLRETLKRLAMGQSAALINDAIKEILQLRKSASLASAAPHNPTPDEFQPEREPQLSADSDDAEYADEDDAPAPAAEAPKWFALKMPDGLYFEAFRYSPWDEHLHRVGGTGFPGVWNEEMARAMAACFNKLGAKVEVVDTATLAPSGLRKA